MAFTNAEKQQRYRDRMRQAGLIQNGIFVDKETKLLSRSSEPCPLTREEFEAELRNLFGMEGENGEIVYAELLAYAKYAEKHLKKVFTEAKDGKAGDKNRATAAKKGTRGKKLLDRLCVIGSVGELKNGCFYFMLLNRIKLDGSHS